ncbi:MAG: type IV secretion system protein [Acidobacteria bacterium]|nr:type IV secretion system protein [Acidobacteriota bacterium]
MGFADLLALLEQASVLTGQVMGAVAPAVQAAGMQLWRGLALIMVVWTGLQMALAGGGVNMAAVVRLVFGLAVPLGMLRFYTAPLPGAGRSVPELVTGMGGWVQALVVADAGNAMLAQIQVAAAAAQEMLVRSGFGGSALRFAVFALTDLPGLADSLFDMAVTVGIMLGLGVGLVFVFALGQAQVMWAQIALSIALLLGPVFIPWIVVPPLAFLFWGWFRTVLVYSLYGAVAAVVFRIVTELGLFVVQGWTGDMGDAAVEWVGPSGITTALRRSLVTLPYLVAACLATLKIGEFTQTLISGAGNVSSGVSTRAVQVTRVAAGGA